MEEEPEKENGERWLLTYSDMITLLLALFIIMYGMSTENQQKVHDLSNAFAEALKGPTTSQVAEGGGGSGTGNGVGDGTGSAMAGIVTNPLDSIYNELKAYIKEANLESDISLIRSEHSISIQFKDNMLFYGNSTKLMPESFKPLETISQTIQKCYDQLYHITITGNTADVAEDKDEPNYEKSSWQLSTDRALVVLNYILDSGVSPEKFSIEGNSHYNPVATNSTTEGRAANRRVDITITDEVH